jgi:tripartite-type tricarboxylate transporter receptor subunit TctC
MLTRRSFIAVTVLGTVSLFSPTIATAQEQPVRIVFPFAAGGGGDALARLIAERMRVALNRTVIVENRTGGAGRIGVVAVKNAKPDGSTLLLTPIAPVAVYQHTYKTLDYDPIKDLRPVSQLVTFDFAVAVGPKVPAKTLKELVAWAKANPKEANYGIPAAGTLPHFLGAMFARAAGIDLRPVPYRGSAATLADLIAGQVPIVITTTSDLAELHKSGKVRVVATSGTRYSPFLPNVPTLREAGLDLAASGWYGMFAPAKTPDSVVARLNKVIVDAVKLPQVSAQVLRLRLEPTGTSAEEFARIQKEDSAFWAQAVKAAGFVADK